VIGEGRYRISWTNTPTELHHFYAGNLISAE
jgi:hypothetical protein